MRYTYYLLFGIFIFFSSCEKKEMPITLPAKGDGSMLQVDMGENYEYQFYINLDLGKVVHATKNNLYHLAFQSGGNQKAVLTNSGQGMAVYNTGKSDFAAVGFNDTLIAYENWKYDAPSNDIDSSAIGNWNTESQVYLIKLGKTNARVRKFQIKYVDAFQYIIHVGDLNSSIGTDIIILKNKDQVFTYFSFDFLTTVTDVEPASNVKWDFVFTLYNKTFYDQNPALPYVVNGVLFHPATLGTVDSNSIYNAINKDFASSRSLVSKKDLIGYSWKNYDRDQNLYTMNNRYNFIIQNGDGRFYKLRFIDFYSATGIKGSPKFEYKLLE